MHDTCLRSCGSNSSEPTLGHLVDVELASIVESGNDIVVDDSMINDSDVYLAFLYPYYALYI